MCVSCRKIKVIIVDMPIILQFFSMDVNMFPALTIYQETEGFSILFSGSWADL